jgi:AraC-like DNA-binding protein
MIPFYSKIASWSSKQDLENYQNRLSNRVHLFDSQFYTFVNLMNTTKTDDRYGEFISQYGSYKTEDYMTIRHVQSDFQQILLAYDMFKDYGIVYDNGLILTRNRNYPRESLSDKYGNDFAVDGFTYEEWVSFLKGASFSGMYPSNLIQSLDFGKYEALLWLQVLSEGSYREGTLYAALDKQRLIDTFMETEFMESGYLLVDGADNQNFLNYQYVEDSGEEYFELSEISKHSGMTFRIGIRKDILSSKLQVIFSLVVLYSLLIIAIGIILAIYFSYRNNRPVRQMVSIASNLDGNIDCHSLSQNEYLFITDTMTSMNQSINNLNTSLAVQKNEMRQVFLEEAVTGSLISAISKARFKELYPDFPATYRIALVSIIDEMQPLEVLISRQLILNQLMGSWFEEEIPTCNLYPHTIVLVLPSGDKNWQEYLAEFLHYTQKESSCKIKIVLSECYTEIPQLADAYTQCQNILHLTMGSEEDIVWQNENFPNRIKKNVFDYTLMQQLYEALSTGDEEIVIPLLNKFQNSIVIDDCTGHIDQFILYNLRSVLVRVKLDRFDLLSCVKIPISNNPQNNDYAPELILKCCKHICEILNKNGAETDLFANEIISYIDEHVYNSDFYTKTVMNAFDISENTLQKVIKRKTSSTFFEYIEEKRLKKAYYLLETTRLIINEVADQCGFSNYNSMYKSFKRNYNISPGSVERPGAK